MTSGDDTITAEAVALDGSTLIDQGGTDTLTASIEQSTDLDATTTINGIETLNLSTDTVADITLDLDNVTGATEINILRNDLVDGAIDGTGTIDLDNVVAGATINLNAQIDDAEVNFDADGSGGTINAGASVASLLVSGIDSNGVSVVASAEDAALDLRGTTSNDDAASISVFGENAVDVGGATGTVETVTIEGNGAANQVTVSDTADEGEDQTFVLEGSQDITLVSTAAILTGSTLTNNNTGTVAVQASAAGALDLSNFDAVSSVLLDADFGGDTVTVNSGEKITTATDQGGALTIAAADDAADDNVVTFEVLDNETDNDGFDGDDLVFTDFATVQIVANAETIDAVDLTAAGDDVVISGTQDVTLTGVVNAASVDASGLSGDLTITNIGITNDTDVTAGDGDDDILVNTTNVVSVNLGDGDNTLDVDDATTASVLAMGSGSDTVTLSETDAVVLSTGAGNDTVTIDVATDANISMGAGTDQAVIDGGADLDVSDNTNFALNGVTELTLNDGLAVSLAQFAGFNDVKLSGTSADVLIVNGTANADIIDLSNLTFKVGTTTTTEVVAGDGDDTITGSDADDDIAGGAGADTITGGAGDDTIDGGAGDDTITGGAGGDIILGGAGADTLDGGAGDDVFIIADPDHFAAGESIDGGADNDTIRFTSTTADDTLTLSSDVTNVETIAVADADGTDNATDIDIDASAMAAAEDVALTGGTGDNELTGNDGDNVITGGAGDDTITGGAGDDTFVNSDIDNNGTDTFADFTTTVDSLQLSIADLNALTGAATFTAGDTLGGDAGTFEDIDDGGTLTGGDGAGTFIFIEGSGQLIFDAAGDTDVAADDSTTDAAGDDIVIATGIADFAAADITFVA